MWYISFPYTPHPAQQWTWWCQQSSRLAWPVVNLVKNTNDRRKSLLIFFVNFIFSCGMWEQLCKPFIEGLALGPDEGPRENKEDLCVWVRFTLGPLRHFNAFPGRETMASRQAPTAAMRKTRTFVQMVALPSVAAREVESCMFRHRSLVCHWPPPHPFLTINLIHPHPPPST